MRAIIKITTLIGLAACLASCSTISGSNGQPQSNDPNTPTTPPTKKNIKKSIKLCNSTWKKDRSQPPQCTDIHKKSCLKKIAENYQSRYKSIKKVARSCKIAADSGDKQAALNYGDTLLLRTNGWLTLSIEKIELFIKGEWRPTYKYNALACEYGVRSKFPEFRNAKDQSKVKDYLKTRKPKNGYNNSIIPILSICYGPRDIQVYNQINGASKNHHPLS
jgi:hypothetical protein